MQGANAKLSSPDPTVINLSTPGHVHMFTQLSYPDVHDSGHAYDPEATEQANACWWQLQQFRSVKVTMAGDMSHMGRQNAQVDGTTEADDRKWRLYKRFGTCQCGSANQPLRASRIDRNSSRQQQAGQQICDWIHIWLARGRSVKREDAKKRMQSGVCGREGGSMRADGGGGAEGWGQNSSLIC